MIVVDRGRMGIIIFRFGGTSMRKNLVWSLLLALLLTIAGTAQASDGSADSNEKASAATSEPAPQAKESPCCFSRAGYDGICVVTPGNEETCDSILQYLNSPGTVGKTYCGGSDFRGGWQKVKCPGTDQEEEESCVEP